MRISVAKGREAITRFARLSRSVQSLDGVFQDVREYQFHILLAEWHVSNTLKMIDRYRCPRCMQRPSDFPQDDGELIDALKKARRRFRPDDKDLMLLRRFGRWRNAVMLVESMSMSNLVLLLRVLVHLDIAALDEEASRLRRFIDEEYGIKKMKEFMDRNEINEIAAKYSRRNDIMSDNLLNAGHYVRKVRIGGDVTQLSLLI